jgi:hypothetical protein
MTVAIRSLLERMAQTGTAPEDGCHLFGVGHDDALRRIRQSYLIGRLARGGSAEKFVIGPFGSGKTHFLRQLMELARTLGCVTAEVALNKEIDFTQSLVVYREVTRELRIDGHPGRGLRALVPAVIAQVQSGARPGSPAAERLLQAWMAALPQVNFRLETFGRLFRSALQAHLADDENRLEAALRWLGGEVSDRHLSQQFGVPAVPRSEWNLYARRALLSLFQLVRHAGFAGTVVGFDEAEQGLSVEKRRLQQILSMLQSGINAMADLDRGSALVVYALTPDLRDEMMQFAALQQRVADPGPGLGFYDGNTLAPMIDLTQRADPLEDLHAIGQRLVDLLYQMAEGAHHTVDAAQVRETVAEIAAEIAENERSTSNRRTMVKRTCAVLIRLADEGILLDAPTLAVFGEEDEI